MKYSFLSAAILGALGLGSTFSALAANNYLVEMCVGEVADAAVIKPALAGVPVWGYAQGGVDTAGNCINTPTLPGPTIRIPDADASSIPYDGLTVNLVNTMSRPTSIVIPGTIKSMTPQTFTDSAGLQRVRSFDVEAAANGGTTSYSWNNLPSGSYMYHSGTQPQVQVQMGLYGGVINDEVDGSEAYPGKLYEQDIVLFYMEFDPQLHANAVNGDYDLVNGAAASTIDYKPSIFLLSVDENVAGLQLSFDFTDVPTLKLSNGLDPMFRLFNAGQRLHVPTVADASFDLLAQDGKLMPNTTQQYTVSLPPLKVKDAVLNISGNPSLYLGGAGSFRLTDSAMNLSNPIGTFGAALALSGNGAGATDHSNEHCLACLNIEVAAKPGYVESQPSTAAPIAVKDELTVLEDGEILNILAKALNNDVDISGNPLAMGDVTTAILSQPTEGVLVNDGGSLHYRHNGGENEHDSIVYSITNAAGEQSSTSITLRVAPVNDAPLAKDDVVTTSLDHTVIEIRPMNNDSDVDSDGIRIVSVGTSGLGDLEAQEKVIIFKPTSEGSDVVAYQIEDTEGKTASANISISVAAATAGSGAIYAGGSDSSDGNGTTGVPPVALDDSYTMIEGGTLEIAETETIRGVMANDSGASGVDTTLKVYPEHGTILMRENGTFTYEHDGSEDDDDRFVYEAYNANGKSSAEVVIKIREKMNPPKVNNDKARTRVDTPVLIDLLRNDKDKDSALDPNGIVITKQPKHGTVEIVTAGEVRYTPDAGYRGKDSFRYRLKDAITGELSKRAAKVKIKIKN